MANITNEMVITLYKAFKQVYMNNKIIFNNKKTREIEEVFKLLGENERDKWNKNSLKMYIDYLIYAIKGKKYTRFLNKFAYSYFENNLCKDFPEKCENVKNAFKMHFEYKANILKKYQK